MEEERRNLEPGVGRSARRRKEASGPKETGGQEGARQPGADETFRRDLHAAGRQFHEAAR